jgi:hypothetical protein
MGHLQQCSRSPLSTLGGGGNRTRVLQYITRASPGAACPAFLSPGGPAGQPPTGSVAVRCPAYPRDRAKRWILLADARHRAGGIPGLTASNSRQAARARPVRFTLALIGLRSQDLRGYVRNPRPASPGSTTEVEACHPLWTCQCQRLGAYTDSARGPYPDVEMLPWVLAVAESHPRGPTGRVGAGHNARASPEMRPGSHHDDWAATPKRHSVT